VNTLLVANFLGWLLIGLGVVQLAPLAAALLFAEPTLPYAASALAAFVFGLSVVLGTKPDDRRLRAREGFLAVGVAWAIASLLGSIPYFIAGVLTPVDALFESVAGFTTTGSSVMTDIESAPRALLLWRAMTQWLGGMGIIVFAIALMPVLGVGGMQLFKAEMAGPVANKITPRVAETARRLWLIYLGLTVTEALLLTLAGMGSFDAICHSLTSVSTGGFSTRNGSIGAFGSPLIEWIVIVFMMAGGINFVLHYRLLTGRAREVARDGELRYFLAIIAIGASLIAFALWPVEAGQDGTIRRALFQIVSITTTTGYATADFGAWPGLAMLVLLQAMVLGAMAGSTSGGIKGLRTLIGLRALASVFVRQLHPQAVSHPTRYAGERVPDDVLAGIWAFITAYFLIAAVVAGIVAASGYDLITSITTAATTLGNVGPGLGEIGPANNFAHFPGHVKLVLSTAMLAGRLEIFTILIVFHPVFWRR
jgi:trk system potassium uptake protein TrkH